MKKIISGILTAAMLCCNAVNVFGAIGAPSEWAMEYIEKADRAGITDGFSVYWTKNVTREQFCELIFNLIEVVEDIELKEDIPMVFEDTDNTKISYLNQVGIIEGKSETEFAPDDFLTREEAAVILERIGKYWNLEHTELYYLFDDEEEISDRAMNGVQVSCNLGVMRGVGDNKFAPKEALTVEQAITTIVNMFDLVSEDEFLYLTFADKLKKCMSKDKNYMYSPLSIKMALLMAANGASGDTKEEILKAVGIKSDAHLEHYNDCVKLMIEEYSESENLKISISNSAWINQDKTGQRFSGEYADKLKDIFKADLGVVTEENAVKEINAWVNEKTAGKIPAVINEDNADFWAMLVNAVYFKGRWQSVFNKGATKKDVFTSRDGEEKSVDFMNKVSWFEYAEKDGVKIVELPYYSEKEYGESISMYLMISDEEFFVEDILREEYFDRKYVDLSVPKFNIEYSADLESILNTIGINRAFDEEAEFGAMFDGGNMWIDGVIHKTYIKVDEEGTEAAAVTGMGMGGSSRPPEPLVLKFNKPFTFVIKDNINGEILFVGEYAYAE